MDFDTLFYIFFIVVSLIFSIIGSNKRKNQRKRAMPDSDEGLPYQEESSDFETLVKQIQEEISQSTLEREYNKEGEYNYDENSYQQEKVENDTQYALPTDDPKKSVIESESYLSNENDLPEEGIPALLPVSQSRSAYYQDNVSNKEIRRPFDFDPVKAVIYTEILKRPEY
jgi:predicted hydrolase (HD superfamily)